MPFEIVSVIPDVVACDIPALKLIDLLMPEKKFLEPLAPIPNSEKPPPILVPPPPKRPKDDPMLVDFVIVVDSECA
jgi:hypothetical protein